MSIEDQFFRIARQDGRYSGHAFVFLHDALDYTVHQLERAHLEEEGARHVSGRELYRGLVAFAKLKFGPLAAVVWRSWGVERPLDWGEIVFLLVERKLLRSRPEDTLEDFDLSEEFEKLFVDGYEVPELQ